MHVNVGNQGRPKVENSYWPEIEPDGGKLDSEMTFQNSDVTVREVFLFFFVLFLYKCRVLCRLESTVFKNL